MRQLLKTIVGTRPDLGLRNRWWHRLVLVTYAFLISCAGVGAAIARGDLDHTTLSVDQRIIITDLYSHTRAFTGAGNAAVAFDSINGWLGFEGASLYPTWFDIARALSAHQFVCKPEGRVFGATEGANSVVSVTPDVLKITIEPVANRPGEAADVVSSVCWGPATFTRVNASQITKFRASIRARMSWWSVNIALGVC